MKKILFGLGVFILICVVHVMLLFRSKYVPPAIRIMKPTEFSKPEEIGAALGHRYWQELKTEQIVVLGLSPFVPGARDIWSAFLRTADRRDVQFDRYFAFQGLPPLSARADIHKFEVFSWPAFNEAVKKGERVLLYHLATDDAVAEILQYVKTGLVLLQAPMVVAESEEIHIQPPCDEKASKLQLSCLALKVSRHYYRKKLSAEKLIAALEKEGALKQILYVHEPALAAASEE